MRIERIIHQTWKTRDIPRHIYREEWMDSWRRHHPDWEYRLWTDADNRRLIAEDFPWFLETYDGYPAGILRADAARYFILFKHGGLYVDLDYRSLRNIEPLLKDYDLVLTYVCSDKAHWHGTSNAIMASRSGLPLWLDVFREMRKMSRADTIIEFKTGPVMLKKVLRRYRQKQFFSSLAGHRPARIKIYPPEYLCPIDHSRYSIFKRSLPQAFLDDPQGHFPRAYAVTFWAHNWDDPYYHMMETRSL